MQMTGWQFAEKSPSEGLRMDTKTDSPPAIQRSTMRQSKALIIYAGAKSLPFFTPAITLICYILRRVFPAVEKQISMGWSAGLSAVGLSLLWGVAVWLCSSWQLSDDRLHIRSGVFVRREGTIHRLAIRSVETEKTPVTALLGSVRLRVCTVDHGSDVLLLPASGAHILASRLVTSSKGHTHSYRAYPGALWLAALGGEGLAAFYSAVAPVLSAVRDTTFSLLERGLTVLTDSNGIVAASGALLAAVWLLKVIHTRIIHAKMGFTLTGETLLMHMGVVSRRIHRISAARICAFDIRLSLLGKLLDRRSCTVLLPGQRSYPLLPPVDNRRLRIETAVIARHGQRICTVCPLSSGLSYAAGRWGTCFALLPVISVLRRAIPSWSITVPALGVTLALLLVWRALVTTVCAGDAGLTLFTDCVELTGVRRLNMHTLRIFRPTIGLVRITQSPLSRLLGRCTLRIIPQGCPHSAVSCIKLPLERTLAVCQRIM